MLEKCLNCGLKKFFKTNNLNFPSSIITTKHLKVVDKQPTCYHCISYWYLNNIKKSLKTAFNISPRPCLSTCLDLFNFILYSTHDVVMIYSFCLCNRLNPPAKQSDSVVPILTLLKAKLKNVTGACLLSDKLTTSVNIIITLCPQTDGHVSQVRGESWKHVS